MIKKSTSALALALTLTSTVLIPASFGQRPPTGGDGEGSFPPPRHNHVPTFVPPPPAPPENPRPFFPPVNPPTFHDPLQPLDLTKHNVTIPDFSNPKIQEMIAAGIQAVPDDLFEKRSSGDESSEWILVRGDENSKYEKTSPTSVKLDVGTVLVSVRRPSRYALIKTPTGDISIGADGDVLVSFNDGVTRVDNISGRGMRCLVKLDKNLVGNTKTIAIAPGYELVAGDHKLTRADVRPGDGIGRRGFSLIANGQIAVNEFSVESFLNSSAIVASITGASTKDTKEHRVLSDMSKMAAVLNYVNGSGGYSSSSNGLATKPTSATQ